MDLRGIKYNSTTFISVNNEISDMVSVRVAIVRPSSVSDCSTRPIHRRQSWHISRAACRRLAPSSWRRCIDSDADPVHSLCRNRTWSRCRRWWPLRICCELHRRRRWRTHERSCTTPECSRRLSHWALLSTPEYRSVASRQRRTNDRRASGSETSLQTPKHHWLLETLSPPLWIKKRFWRPRRRKKKRG